VDTDTRGVLMEDREKWRGLCYKMDHLCGIISRGWWLCCRSVPHSHPYPQEANTAI